MLLKTSNYPNKAIVAYATLLSSSPKAQAGGVEIGKQFYKVHINHPTVQEEPLVRPMTGYRTIGDAHAKGVPIAWSLICVCYSYLSSYVVLASYLMHVQVINFTTPLHYAG